jgi:hypothetical protein
MKLWLDYAEAHQAVYDSRIRDDYFIGYAWRDWGRAMRRQLNGETGALDCHTADGVLVSPLARQGSAE